MRSQDEKKEALGPKDVRWISLKRYWLKSAAFFGVGVGWDAKAFDACVFFSLGRWMLTIGPHYPTEHKEKKE